MASAAKPGARRPWFLSDRYSFWFLLVLAVGMDVFLPVSIVLLLVAYGLYGFLALCVFSLGSAFRFSVLILLFSLL